MKISELRQRQLIRAGKNAATGLVELARLVQEEDTGQALILNISKKMAAIKGSMNELEHIAFEIITDAAAKKWESRDLPPLPPEGA